MLLASIVLALQTKAFVHHATAEYRTVLVEDHIVHVSPEADEDHKLITAVLNKLDSDLKMIHGLLPKPAMAKLSKLQFWVEHDNPETPGMVYHPGLEWLKQHGYNIDKAKNIEIGNMQHFLDWHKIQPFMVLHEMSHAYHDQVFGFENQEVKAAYENAVASHKYDMVDYAGGGKRKAYALTNAQEYFAELSEAYWGKNDFYPFIRSDLKTFDPQGYALIDKLWNAVPLGSPASAGSGSSRSG